MKNKKSILSIAIFLLIAFVIAGCGVIPTQPKGAIEGRVLVPPSASEMSKDVSGWVPAAGATVTVVDANGVTHTVTTDEDGYYSFENIAVNPNTVVTATVEVDGKTIVLKKVIPDAVAEDEDYDAGTMTPESTALALVVETLVDEGVEPEDIYLGEILGSDSFEDLVENVTTAIEEEKDVTEDPDVTGGAGDIADEILNPPTPPSPPSGPSTISVTGVTLDRTTLTLTAGGDTGTLTATVAPANATNKNITWVSDDEAVATVADGIVTPLAAGTANIAVTTEDGEFTAICVVTVEAAPVEVTGYDAIADIDGGKEGAPTYATAADAVEALPATVTITGTEVTVPVTWSADSAPAYATTEGTYVFTGTIGTLPDGYVDAVDTIETVTANVVIAAADPIAVIAVTLDKPTLTLTAGGDTGTLTATVAPENATNKNITWESSDETIATVSDGVVTPLAAGKATITVTTEDGGFKTTCVVTVSNPEFNGNVSGQIITDESGNVSGTLTGDYSLAVSGTVTEYIANGATFIGTVTGDINGDIIADINAQGIDTLYGIIENTGAVETVRIIGTFPQSGIDGDFTGEIITGDELSHVETLEITGDDVVNVGDTITLGANITPGTATDKVFWSVYVGHPDIATIDQETGVLTGVSAGTATVIVKTYDDSNLSFATKQITVVDGKVINVTQKIGYDTIQAAVDETIDGDVIEIAAGTYDENIVVPEEKVKSITILGANSDTIPTSPGIDGTIITGGMTFGRDISSNPTIEKSITVKGITFFGGSGLIFKDIRNVTAENNKFIDITAGDGAIVVLDPSNHTVEGFTTISNNYICCVAGTSLGLGIYVRRPQSEETVITGNHVEDTNFNAIQVNGVVTDAKITITENKLINWDADNDSTDGGRALRGAASASEFIFTNNVLVKADWAESPVDPNFVKVTGLQDSATVDFNYNYWNSSEPDFDTILDGSDPSVLDSIDNYYSDEEMTTLVTLD